MSGFTSNPSYNGTFKVFNIISNTSFDVDVLFGTVEAGVADTVRLEITTSGTHGINPGDGIKLSKTNFYNGFYTALDDPTTTTLIVNGTFIVGSTTAAPGEILIRKGVDQSDPRVVTDSNARERSHYIVGAHVNDNQTLQLAPLADRYIDLVFGAANAALTADTVMERWRMINDVSGLFEYEGNEPYDGLVTVDLAVEAGSNSQTFTFKIMKSILDATPVTTSVEFDDAASPSEIIAVGEDFIASGFEIGDRIEVSGAMNALNNAAFTISSIGGTGNDTLILDAADELVTEGPTANVTVIAAFEDLEDPVEAHLEWANNTAMRNVTKTFPLLADKGNQIKILVNSSTADNFLTRWATMYGTVE